MRYVSVCFVAGLASLLGGCGASSRTPKDMGVSIDMQAPTGDGFIINGTLAITPVAPTVTVIEGQTPPTVQFMANVDGQPVTPTWAIDRGEIGSISAAGLFTTPGTIGGQATISALYGGEKTTTLVTVQLQHVDVGDPAYGMTADAGAGGYGGVGGDGPGGPASSTQQQTLNGTPTVDATVTLLYPYDQTVWPRGLLPPLLQWSAGAHHFDSVYVHLVESNYEYKGYFAANNANFVDLPLPSLPWTELTFSNGGEAVTVSLIFAEGSSAYGPYTMSWKVAPATLKGTVYYNSYGTYLVKNSNSNDATGHQYGAATLGINPGATSPVLVAGVASADGTGCRVCHTVSGNGQVLVTQKSNADATDYSDTRVVNLLADATGGSGTSSATGNLTFPALSPDGKLLFSGADGLLNEPATSGLFALPAGTAVASTGLPAGLAATLPTFSPDGKHLAFNLWTGTIGAVNGDKASLAMIDFDGTSVFTNPQILYTPPDLTKPVTWSSFLPDGKGVIFEVELETHEFGFTRNQNKGELWWIDLATKTATRLANANGVGLPTDGAAGKHPAGLDATLNYEPTVNPIASGGYAWVVYTSRRMYGNVATQDPFVSDPRNYDATVNINTKKLWVAAIDLNAAAGTDPSHPAFYLPAQELHAGNSRGFWTVEPCHMDGKGCMTGDECCGGYCEPGGDGGLVCTSTPPICSADFEKCTVDADCCSGADPLACINGVCTLSSPPIP